MIRFSDSTWTHFYIITWVWLGAFIFRGIFVGGTYYFDAEMSSLYKCVILVMVQNFERISEAIKKQKKAQLRQRKFQRMRNKLDTELAAQNGIEQSMYDFMCRFL